MCKCEDNGKQERRNETTFMDLIKSNAMGSFAVFDVSRFDQAA